MFIYFRYLIRLIFCLTILLWAGCLPKGCLGKLGELNEAKPVIKQGTITEHIDPSYEGRTPYRSFHDPNDTSGSKTPKGSKSGGITLVTPPSIPCRELDEIRVNGPEVLLFVDKNASAQGKGTSWPDAVRTITEATKKAMAIQAIELSNGRPPKDIFIIIASGVYDLAHEKAINNLNHNSSIIDLETFSPNYHQHIAFLGGYKVDDTCLENDKNIARRPTSSSDRDVIIDGSNGAYQSNHVVIVSSGHDIKFKDITIKHGHAQDSASPHGAQGGGILLKNSHHIELDRVTILEAKANTGGGIAIILNSHDITIKDSKIEGCKADDGGAIALIDNSRVNDLSQVVFSHNSSRMNGGALYVKDAYIERHSSCTYEHNKALISGGAFYIDGAKDRNTGNYAKFPLDNIVCKHNHASNTGGCGLIRKSPGSSINDGEYDNNGHEDHVDPSFMVNKTRKGGAIYYASDQLLEANGYVFNIFNNAAFTNNYVTEDGAAIYFSSVYNIKFDSVTFQYNIAEGKGGVYADFTNYNLSSDINNRYGAKVVIANNSVFADNEASHGGALYLSNCVRELIINPDAQPLSAFMLNEAKHHGGAIYAGFCSSIPPPPLKNRLVLVGSNNVVIDSNRAGYNHGVITDINASGGGIYLAKAPQEIRLAAHFNDNKAAKHGGAIAIEGYIPINNIRMNVGAVDNAPGGTAFTPTDGKFINNQAINGDGGAIYIGPNVAINHIDQGKIRGHYENNQALATANGKGSALAIMGDILPANQLFTVEAATFKDNKAQQSTMHLVHPPQEGLKFIGCNFDNNKSAIGGGIMNFLNPADPPINRLIFEPLRLDLLGNLINPPKRGKIAKHDNNGGAFYIDITVNNELTIDSQDISYNKSAGSGGFMLMQFSPHTLDVKIKETSFIGNESQGDGGALALNQAHDVTIEERDEVNIAGRMVSALENAHTSFIKRYLGLKHGPKTAEENIAISKGNTAANHGGLIYINRVRNNMIIKNQFWLHNTSSAGSGGALYVNKVDNDLTIHNPLFFQNIAHNHGGALAINKVGRSVLLDSYQGPGKDHSFHPIHITTWPGFFGRTFRDQKAEISVNDVLGIMGEYYYGVNPLPQALPNFWSGNNSNYRGQFLLYLNTAQHGDGGAIYINKARDMKIERMSFYFNNALVGGSLYINDLRRNLEVRDTIIYQSLANNNAGAMFIGGDNAALNNEKQVLLENSLFQQNISNGLNVNGGAAAVYVKDMDAISIDQSNFFYNTITAGHTPGIWAAALKWDRLPGAFLPTINPDLSALYPQGYDSTLSLGEARPGGISNALYLDGLYNPDLTIPVPLYLLGPINMNGNQVLNPSATDTANFSIPNNIKTNPKYMVNIRVTPGPPPQYYSDAATQPILIDSVPTPTATVVSGH